MNGPICRCSPTHTSGAGNRLAASAHGYRRGLSTPLSDRRGLDFEEWLVLRRGYAALTEAQRRAKTPENGQFGPLPPGIRGSRATAWAACSSCTLSRAAADEGARTFDFLRGSEPYKYPFGARDRCDRTWLVPRGPAELG